LQAELISRIRSLAASDGLGQGGWLNENELARRLGVSRSPVRAALGRLAAQGVVARRRHRGIEITGELAEATAVEEASTADIDELLIRIARERRAGQLPDAVSEAALMRQYARSRPLVQRLLHRLAELGIIARKAGYGWRFLPIFDGEHRQESYRFRALIEPAAILEPGFRLDPTFAESMRQRHTEALQTPWTWTATASIAFYEMNAAFHEGVAAASGNRFVAAAIRHQNQLRRFVNYERGYGEARMVTSCRQHLEILDRLEAGDHEVAALLMRRHLAEAAALHRQEPGTV